ncbi:hypothetical protein DFH07DRAFT_777543 [Mycena maculata]|uniref:Uncharacterized protein n=1 Tax=Mycena maculata TaxID=230809 RepID=A0AAD7N2S9_9AGAR|nr:hypothetical protein DFH07DRAFT_777543 [Mycena maculata]
MPHCVTIENDYEWGNLARNVWGIWNFATILSSSLSSGPGVNVELHGSAHPPPNRRSSALRTLPYLHSIEFLGPDVSPTVILDHLTIPALDSSSPGFPANWNRYAQRDGRAWKELRRSSLFVKPSLIRVHHLPQNGLRLEIRSPQKWTSEEVDMTMKGNNVEAINARRVSWLAACILAPLARCSPILDNADGRLKEEFTSNSGCGTTIRGKCSFVPSPATATILARGEASWRNISGHAGVRVSDPRRAVLSREWASTRRVTAVGSVANELLERRERCGGLEGFGDDSGHPDSRQGCRKVEVAVDVDRHGRKVRCFYTKAQVNRLLKAGCLRLLPRDGNLGSGDPYEILPRPIMILQEDCYALHPND